MKRINLKKDIEERETGQMAGLSVRSHSYEQCLCLVGTRLDLITELGLGLFDFCNLLIPLGEDDFRCMSIHFLEIDFRTLKLLDPLGAAERKLVGILGFSVGIVEMLLE